MIKSYRRRPAINAKAGPSFPREDVAHQEEPEGAPEEEAEPEGAPEEEKETEGAPEEEEEHDQETAIPDILHQENKGRQEDFDDEMVTLDLEMVNPSRIPSPFLSESTDGTFLGVPPEAAGPSVSQQATPVRTSEEEGGRES